MAKTELTQTIERELFKYFYAKSMRCATEVKCPKENESGWWWNGICDFIAISESGQTFTCIEIKISMSDFKSKNGHNLIGHKNYYCVPSDLVEKVIEHIPKHVGIYSWDGEKIMNVKRCRAIKPPFMNATPHYGINQSDWMKDNFMKASSNMISNLMYEVDLWKNGVRKRM